MGQPPDPTTMILTYPSDNQVALSRVVIAAKIMR
jgi:hypothetical protein